MRTIAPVIALVGSALTAMPASAGESASPWWVPRLRDKQVAVSDEQMAGEEALTSTATPPAEPVTEVPAETAAVAATAAGTTPAAVVPPPPLPNSSLLKAIQQLRGGPIGQDPNAVAYLDLMQVGKASAAQVNDFAAYLAKRGGVRMATQFQQYGTTLAPKDPTLWLNLGTMQRTLGNLGPAADAFQKAIALDPNNGLAHYNLGAVYDADKKYDDAIEEYRRALVLQPDLADPRKNPQVVNNENLLAVKLTIYENQSGALGLPLLQMQKPAETPKDASPDKK